MADTVSLDSMSPATGQDDRTGAKPAPARPGALDGIRVLDLSRVVAGPLAGQTLADLGADVIKVERRQGGDDLRTLGPPWISSQTAPGVDQSTYFQTVNRGKRSLTLDFANPKGAEVLRRLAAGADVFIENFRTGTLDRYGLGYADLAALNPRIIYCSITGFGQDGPYADRSGYDYLAQAMGGQMVVTGHPDDVEGGGPMRVGVPIADITAGNNAVIGIVTALYHRERTGRGQHVDIALYDSQVAILLNTLGSWLNARAPLPKTGNDHPTAVPNGVFPVADGHMLIATFNDREFARLAEALGHAEWGADPRFVRSRDRLENRKLLCGFMADVLRTRSREHWMKVLNAAKVSCGPINDMPDIERDPQLAARNMFVTLQHPVLGDVRVVGSPLKLSESPPRYDRPPPLAGEHNEEILRDLLGMSDADIDDLKRGEVL